MVAVFRVSICKLILSSKKYHFTYSFLICMIFFFSCMIALTRPSNAMSNRASESRTLILFLNIEKTFNYTLIGMMLYVGWPHMVFITLRYIPSLTKCWSSLLWKNAIFSQNLFLYLFICIFYAINMVYCIYRFTC